MKPVLIIRTVAGDFDLTMTPEEVGKLLRLSEDAIRVQCRDGVLPTMPRGSAKSKASWRLPTCRLLDALGIPFEIVPAHQLEELAS